MEGLIMKKKHYSVQQVVAAVKQLQHTDLYHLKR